MGVGRGHGEGGGAHIECGGLRVLSRLPAILSHLSPVVLACWCLGSQGLSPSPCALGEHIPSLCNCTACTTSPHGPGKASAGERGTPRCCLVWQRLEGSKLISRHPPLLGASHPPVKPPEPLSPGPPPSPTYHHPPSRPSLLQHPCPGLYSQCLCCSLILFQTKTKDPARGEVFICFAFLLRL